MTPKTKPLVVFIEDDPAHYKAISEVLLDECECRQFRAEDLPGIKKALSEHIPAVLAVDEMNFRSADEESKFKGEAQHALTQWSTVESATPPTTRPTSPRDRAQPYQSGIECAVELKKEWPTVRVLLYSVLAEGVAGSKDLWYEVVGKVIVDDVLKNGAAIAAKIRAMIQDRPVK